MSSLTGIDLLLCCCAGCIRGDDNSTELYSALNLSPSATAEDIRKAWRSYSLRLHPDKLAQRGKTVTPDDQAQFIRAKDAHSVLSDPLRRRMYDSYGANGVKWAEDPSSIDPHTIYKNFTHATTADRARVVLMFALITGAVLLFPILLCLKIDGAGLSWVLVALPLLVLELLWLTLQLMGLAAIKRARGRAKRRQQQRSSQPDCGTSHQQGDSVGATKEDPTGNSSSDDDDDDDDDGTDDVDNLLGEEDDDKDPWGRKMALEIALVGAAGTGLALFWQVLVVLKLQFTLQGMPYEVCLLPLLASELLSAAHNANMSKLPVDTGEAERLVAGGQSAASAAAAAAAAAEEEGQRQDSDEEKRDKKAARVAMQQSVVGAAKSSTRAHVLRAVFVVLLALKLTALSSSSSSSGASWWVVFLPLWLAFALEIAEDAASLSVKGPAALCHACCGVGFVLFAALLACAKLAGASFSACWIFFPFFAIGGCTLLCVSCVVCCAVDVDDPSSAPHSTRDPSCSSSSSSSSQSGSAAATSPLPQGAAAHQPPTGTTDGPTGRSPTPKLEAALPQHSEASPVLLMGDVD